MIRAAFVDFMARITVILGATVLLAVVLMVALLAASYCWGVVVWTALFDDIGRTRKAGEVAK